MGNLGNLHPLLVHFPIALVLTAAAAELAAIFWPGRIWHAVGVINVRAGSVSGVFTAIAGWLLAASPGVEPTSQLQWHRWTGIAGAVIATLAALLSLAVTKEALGLTRAYRLALFGAALLVAVAGHLGGTLVWGSPFQQF